MRFKKAWVKIASTNEFKNNGALAKKIKDAHVALFNVDGVFHAIENACYHQGVELHDGFVKDGMVTCPAHAWRFDLKTGACSRDPSIIMKTFKIKVEGEDIFIYL